jgi:NADH:ubiquinone oxidoreductase subunit 6 (subunit J)
MNDGLAGATLPILGWTWSDLLFVVLAAILVGAALLVVIGRDIIRSGLAMMVSFGALAGIYVLLNAPLVAAAQVLVYIGAISVLVLFAIMLTQTKAGTARLVFHRQAWAAALAALVLVVVLAVVATSTAWPGATSEAAHTGTDALARLLLDQYVLPLEIVSVLLLAAVIGGVFLARQEEDRGGDDRGEPR